MTYRVDLSAHLIADCPQWYKNIWNAHATIADIDAELLKFKGVYKLNTQISSSDVRLECSEVSDKHYVEFESEADYLFCLLRWS